MAGRVVVVVGGLREVQLEGDFRAKGVARIMSGRRNVTEPGCFLLLRRRAVRRRLRGLHGNRLGRLPHAGEQDGHADRPVQLQMAER